MIRDLCIALAHRWEPERLFVILTVYLDESGTHGGDGTAHNPASPVMVMAGTMTNARQWAKIAWALDDMRRRYGFATFHAKHMLNGRGEFSGWQKEDLLSLVREMNSLIYSARLIETNSFRMNTEEFARDYLGGDGPRKLRLDTSYSNCFRQCVWHFAHVASSKFSNTQRWKRTKLNFVLEDGHNPNGDAVRVYSEIVKEFRSAGKNFLGEVSFASKQSSVELALADLVAYGTFSMARAVNDGKALPDVFGGSVRGTSRISHRTYRSGGLANVKRLLVDQWNDRRHKSNINVSTQSCDWDGREL